MFKRIDHVEIVTEQFDRTGYGSTDRSIFPESQFGVDAHPSFPNREPPGLESRSRAFPPPRGSPFGISGGAYRVHWVWRKKGRPGKLSRMHAGRFAPTGCLSGRARGQIGSSGAARFTRCDRNQAPSCAMISVITSHDSYLQAFSGEKP